MAKVGAKVLFPFKVIYAIPCGYSDGFTGISLFWFVHGVSIFLPLCYVHDYIPYLLGDITSDSK
jgi:hypothetical protein